MSQEQFDLAVKLADLAVELDELSDTPGFARSRCVDLMHDFATELAGDRAGEIYAQDDEASA